MNLPTVLLMFITRVFGERAGNAAKAILPATGTAVAVVAQWAATGTFDRAEAITAGAGLGASLLAYLVPNMKDPTVAALIEHFQKQSPGGPVLSDTHVVLTAEQWQVMNDAVAKAEAAVAKAEAAQGSPPPVAAAPAPREAPTRAVQAPDPLTEGPLDDLDGPDDDPPPVSDEDVPADVPGMGDTAVAPTTASQQ